MSPSSPTVRDQKHSEESVRAKHNLILEVSDRVAMLLTDNSIDIFFKIADALALGRTSEDC